MRLDEECGVRLRAHLACVQPPVRSERQFDSAPSNLFSPRVVGSSPGGARPVLTRWFRIFVALLISYEVQVNCVVPGLVETRWTATVSEEFSPAGSPSRRACRRRPRPGAATALRAPGTGCRPRRPRRFRFRSAANTRSSAGSGRNPAPSAEVQFRVRLSAGNAIPGRGTVDATASGQPPALHRLQVSARARGRQAISLQR